LEEKNVAVKEKRGRKRENGLQDAEEE